MVVHCRSYNDAYADVIILSWQLALRLLRSYRQHCSDEDAVQRVVERLLSFLAARFSSDLSCRLPGEVLELELQRKSDCWHRLLLASVIFPTVAFAASDAFSDYVTCGSALKLFNSKHRHRLHSHDIKYGTGSGQQSVTGIGEADDANSHWAVKGATDAPCTRGEPVKCGAVIRLEHRKSGKLLHSHLIDSVLSHCHEVSCYGDKGEGDLGDNWILKCPGQYWKRSDDVQFVHEQTRSYLAMTDQVFGRPIQGQHEVCAYPYESHGADTKWRAAEGVYFRSDF